MKREVEMGSRSKMDCRVALSCPRHFVSADSLLLWSLQRLKHEDCASYFALTLFFFLNVALRPQTGFATTVFFPLALVLFWCLLVLLASFFVFLLLLLFLFVCFCFFVFVCLVFVFVFLSVIC